MNKTQFLGSVSEHLYAHPDWLAETQMIIQSSLEERIKDEQHIVSDLAYTMSIYVEQDKKNKIIEKYWDNGVKNGIISLEMFFRGSGFGKKLSELIQSKFTLDK